MAFLGRSNVGKSSLLNALAGVKNLARVSSDPGRTRLVNFFRVGSEFYLVDLPGYGYARVPEAVRQSWGKLVTSYLNDRAPLALCVFLVDSRREPEENDETLRGYLEHLAVPYLVAATKVDKIGRGEANQRVRALQEGLARAARAVIPVSASKGTGIGELWTAIRTVLASPAAGNSSGNIEPDKTASREA